VTKIVPIQPYPGHPLRSLNRFAADADRIVRRYNELNDLPDFVLQKIEAMKNGEQMDATSLIADAKKAATLSKHDEALLARCQTALQLFEPEGNYDDDDNRLKRGVIGERIAVLVGAFPGGSPCDPLVFVTTLVESVCAIDYLTVTALDAAIWRIVGTMKFIPAVSEVLEIVNKQQADWMKRFCSIHGIAESSHWAMGEVEALQAEAEKAAKKRAVQEARHALDRALYQRSKAIAEAVEAQKQAATAAQAVANKMASLAQCEARVLDAERALAEAVKRNTGTVPP
jgi:hypothetical protein